MWINEQNVSNWLKKIPFSTYYFKSSFTLTCCCWLESTYALQKNTHMSRVTRNNCDENIYIIIIWLVLWTRKKYVKYKSCAHAPKTINIFLTKCWIPWKCAIIPLKLTNSLFRSQIRLYNVPYMFRRNINKPYIFMDSILVSKLFTSLLMLNLITPLNLWCSWFRFIT